MEEIMEKKAPACPSIVFRIKGGLYSVNSEHVSSIMTMPEYEVLPDAPPQMNGIFTYRGEAVPMLDLRMFFGMPSLQDEYREFRDMLEARKQDHIHWVDELVRCVKEGEAFTLATDPHKCAFGRWYDTYQSDSHMINHHLHKLDDPHQKLHRAAQEVENCAQQCDLCKRNECLKLVLEKVKGEYEPIVLHLLDETKEMFQSVYHEMLLVLDDGVRLGLIVDEVLAVEDLVDLGRQTDVDQFNSAQFVCGVKQSQKIEGLILELDEERLLNLVGGGVRS